MNNKTNGMHVTRESWEDPRNQLIKKLQKGNIFRGYLVALFIIYAFLIAFNIENNVYGWAVLSVITILCLVLLARAVFNKD